MVIVLGGGAFLPFSHYRTLSSATLASYLAPVSHFVSLPGYSQSGAEGTVEWC